MDDIIGNVTQETKEKLREFDEQEAYFLLCEIFSYAQATKDYTRFQADLNEWKKRFPIEMFSEIYKIKIKYMLSKEFLDTVLKNFVFFDELSKKNPSDGLNKLRKILSKAEKHKNEKKLDSDLEELYKEFPLKYLKEKYPHVVGQLLSKSNRTRILEKFDSLLAFKELNKITENPQNFNTADDFKNAIEEWEKIYPLSDFNDKYKSEVEKILTESLNTKKIESLYPSSLELDLSQGEVLPLTLNVKQLSLISKDALHDFSKITNKNIKDINGLFDWICKYSKYINSFDNTIKFAIVDSLISKYRNELPPTGTKFQMPKMESGENDLLSLSEYVSINDTKKQVVLQLLGILSTEKDLSNEDIYRLSIIDINVKKAKIIEKAKIEKKVQIFVEEFPENKLTASDDVYLEPVSNTQLNIEFKNSLKVNEVVPPTSRISGATGNTDSGNNSGGWSSSMVLCTNKNESISKESIELLEKEEKEENYTDTEKHERRNPIKNFFTRLIKKDDEERDDR